MIHTRTLESLEFGKIRESLSSHCLMPAAKDQALALRPFESAREAVEAFNLINDFRNWQAAPTIRKYQPTALPDMRGMLAAASKGAQKEYVKFQPDTDSFWALRETLKSAQNALESIEISQGLSEWPSLHKKAVELNFPVQLLAALERCISDDGLLKDESSPELFRLRNELRNLHQSCLHKVKDFAQQYNMLACLQDEFMTLSSDRYVIPLKANFKGRMQGVIHDWSQTGETCYFEPMFLVEINNRLRQLKHEEREEEQKILAYLMSLLIQELPETENAFHFLVDLDFVNAKIALSEKLQATCPVFTGSEAGLEILEARHPLLLLARQKDEKAEKVRPLDIVLRPGENALIITGGNAGGKTVCLKTLGLVAVMAMSGLPVPVGAGSHLPWFERLDAFIGDEQSLDANVSTFTAQIDHLAKAWKYLNEKGLVLLDEFGAGTDPAEGAALAQAVLDGLADKKCLVLAATHFPALKAYALTRDGVRSAAMLFNPQTNRPLFKLAYDQVGSSLALDVAREHGLPQTILERAGHYLLQDGQDSSAIMSRLNSLAAQREDELASLKKEKNRADNILQDRLQKLDREKRRLQEEVRSLISQVMQDFRENKLSAKQAAKGLSGIRDELGLPPLQDNSILPAAENFKKDQTVLHAAFNKRGVIREIDEKRQRAKIDLAGVSLWADFKDLRASSNSDKGPVAAVSARNVQPARGLTLDLRGKRADEALLEVEKFMDKALLAGFSEVEIVHGRGTGALRRQIHEFLKSFPPAKSFSLAPEDRGGDGMTIVELA